MIGVYLICDSHHEIIFKCKAELILYENMIVIRI